MLLGKVVVQITFAISKATFLVAPPVHEGDLVPAHGVVVATPRAVVGT